ncbi:MAG: gluconokinase [Opitutales bacterium]
MRWQVVIVMGVSGCGKTTVGQALARATGGTFEDGDGFHPPANVAKMRRGEPLTDADRAGWLAALRERAEERFAQTTAKASAQLILASSALRRSYRAQLLQPGEPGCFVYLKATHAAIARRLEAREGHFFPPELLASQFATLEEPTAAESNVHTVPIEGLDETAVLQSVLQALALPLLE